MTNRHTLILALLALAGCTTSHGDAVPDPRCATDGALELQTVGVQRADDVDLTLAGVDLDGEATAPGDAPEPDYTDPDGTPGVDASGTDMEWLVTEIYDQGIDEAVAGQPLALDLRYAHEADGSCAGLDVALSEGPWAAASWNGSTYRAHELGDAPFAIDLGGVSTGVTLRDVAVRLEIEGDRVSSAVIGGWIGTDDLYTAAIASLNESELEEYDEAIVALIDAFADVDADRDGEPDGVSFMFRTVRSR
jgi:hypothetical protein